LHNSIINYAQDNDFMLNAADLVIHENQKRPLCFFIKRDVLQHPAHVFAAEDVLGSINFIENKEFALYYIAHALPWSRAELHQISFQLAAYISISQ
jgi:hypothetical protein